MIIIGAWQNLQLGRSFLPAARVMPRMRLSGIGAEYAEVVKSSTLVHELTLVEINGIPSWVSPNTRWLISGDPWEWVETSRLEIGSRVLSPEGAWSAVTGLGQYGCAPAVKIKTTPQRVRVLGGILHG